MLYTNELPYLISIGTKEVKGKTTLLQWLFLIKN